MGKITVEVNVPEGDFCHGCRRCVPWRDSCTLGCDLFQKRLDATQQLPECHASVKKQITPKQIGQMVYECIYEMRNSMATGRDDELLAEKVNRFFAPTGEGE